MKPVLALALFLATIPVFVTADELPQRRSGVAACEVLRPSGDYAVAILKLSIPGDPESSDRSKRETQHWTYVGGVRDGRMRVDDGVGLREPGGWLEVKGGKLIGKFRRVDLNAEVSIDATIIGNTINGIGKVGDREAVVQGEYITEDQLAKRNAVAKTLSWPVAQGPLMGGCASQLTGVDTLDDVADLRMVWRCEETDIGRGMGNISRFMVVKWEDAAERRTGSGCASPLVAEGKVFFKYFVPNPGDADDQDHEIQEYLLKAKPPATGFVRATPKLAAAHLLERAKAAGFQGKELPGYAIEKTFATCDDIVLCMDAATGKTLWKAVVKNRGRNSQHHKVGPFDMSPAYANGRVFALGMSGWLYAFDTESGEPLWEVEAGYAHSNSLLAVGNVVVGPCGQRRWGAYDAATGKLLWGGGPEYAMSTSTFSAWSHNGNDYLIGRTTGRYPAKGLVCLEAKTGKPIWELSLMVFTGGRGFGPGGVTIFGDTMLVNQDNGSGVKGEPRKPVLAAYRLTTSAPKLLWQLEPMPEYWRQEKIHGTDGGPIHNESVPVVVRGKYVFTADLRVVDLATGKAISRSKGLRPMNGGYMQAIEDIVLVRRDGTHGNMECGIYKTTEDGNVRCLTGEGSWVPPIGGTTTSYHHPIFYPMVGGRVFFRQENGIYCWDIRGR